MATAAAMAKAAAMAIATATAGAADVRNPRRAGRHAPSGHHVLQRSSWQVWGCSGAGRPSAAVQ
eukprot:6192716-Pleurochrysis_carterae.AAC.4